MKMILNMVTHNKLELYFKIQKQNEEKKLKVNKRLDFKFLCIL